MSLADDLNRAERAARLERDCSACIAIRDSSEADKADLTRAFAGSIGINTLIEILAKNEVKGGGEPIGRRTIMRHRNEEHTP